MMNRIAIIGAGQLGSRHLQGLKKARIEMSIWVVDTSKESLDLAKNRYDEIPENSYKKSVKYVSSINSLPKELELVIVATSSAPRRLIIENLLSEKKIKNIVLEKFLFQCIDDYDVIEKLLVDKGIFLNTWVNCPRRMTGYYEQIKSQFASITPLTMQVTGTNWGLCCNAIHFIDILAYITLETQWDFIVDDIKQIESRRSGYVEFSGKIIGTSSRGDTISLISMLDGNNPVITTISGGGKEIVLDETNLTMRCGTQKEELIEIKYQSELTEIIAEQILKNDCSSLTSYGDSSKLHKAFLIALVSHYNKLNNKQGMYCPIT